MCAAEKSSRWLITCIAFLVILVVALITAVVLMKIGQKPKEDPQSHELIAQSPSFTVTKSPEVVTSKLAEKTSRPTTVTVTPSPTIAPVIEFSRPHIQEPLKICKSPECILLAHQLHNWQDISVDPCQNFYKAACGKYNEYTIEEGNRVQFKDKILSQLIKDHLDKIEPTDSKSEISMQLYYQKCLETKKFNATILEKEAQNELNRKANLIAPWYSEWDESKFDLNDVLSKMASLGESNFGLFSIVRSSKNIVVSQKFSYELGDKIKEVDVNGVAKYLLSAYKLKSSDQNDADEKSLEELLNKLIQAMQNQDKRRKKLPPRLGNLSDLQSVAPSVDFERIFKNLMNPIRKDSVWEKIRGKVFVDDSSYLFDDKLNLEIILKTTPKRTLANFLMSYFIIKERQYNEQEMRSFERRSCHEIVLQTFPLASLRIFVRNHFDKKNLDVASELVEDIRQNFIEFLQESTWLSDKTKKKATKKSKMMKKLVGYPEEFEAPGALDSFFDTLNLSKEDSYFEMISKTQIFASIILMDNLASVFPMKRGMLHFETSAFYDVGLNQLTLNVPFIDEPFLDYTYPNYAKIASIGEVIAHEMGHGFDPHGRTFDGNGKRKNWWTPEDSKEYDRRAQCLVRQYNDYDDPDFGKNLSGSNTLDEMAADTFGLNVSWKTYKKLDLSREPKIIGFEDYSMDKLFFRITALNFCRSRSNIRLEDQLNDPHPTDSFRVNGIFSNMKSFAEAYNCPVGTPMNPVKKCELF